MTSKMLIEAERIQDQLVAWRRDIHMHPEISFTEHRTAELAASALEAMGGRVQRGVGKTGVVADFGVPVGQGQACIAIRADMDALPLQENNQVPYASQIPGIMHACGHDAHVAMALGAAALLSKLALPGTVRILIQPSEETNDSEGLSGAERMLADGALEGVNLIIAQHVDPSTPVGKIRLEAGPASGGVDSFFGRIVGTGGHGAWPHKTVDPFYLCAHVIMALNGIVSRRLNPFAPAVVSIGAVHGGQAENVIPAYVDIAGTLRYTETKVQRQIHAEIQRAFELARTLGGDFELRFDLGSPPMTNHPQAVDLLLTTAGKVVGRQNILPINKDLGAEDFGVFLERAPGAMYNLGAEMDGSTRLLHSPVFDLDERALPIGAAILAEASLQFFGVSQI